MIKKNKYIRFICIALLFPISVLSQADQAALFDGALILRVGDNLEISNPKGSNGKVYKDILTDNKNQKSLANGARNYSGRITGFDKGPDGRQAVAKMKTDDGKELFVQLPQALVENEAQFNGLPFLTLKTLFNFYVQTMPSVSNDLAASYLNEFDRPGTSLNEFQKNRLILSAKNLLDSVRTSPKPEHFIQCNILEAGDYDFKSKSFPIRTSVSPSIYPIELPSGILRFYVQYAIPEIITAKVLEEKAEEIVTKYFTDKSARQFYCIYNLVIKSVSAASTSDPSLATMPGYSHSMAFAIQVKSVDVYVTPELSEKIVTVDLTSNSK